MTASPLKYSGSFWNSSKNVSVGCAAAGAVDRRFCTFSCAKIDAWRPTASTADPKLAPRGKNPADAIVALPPTCSGAALVFTMYRIGRGGGGELMTAFMYGMGHPPAPRQMAPEEVFGICGVGAPVSRWVAPAR